MALDLLNGPYDEMIGPQALPVALGARQAYIGLDTIREYMPAFEQIVRFYRDHGADLTHQVRRSNLVRQHIVSTRYMTSVWEKVIASLGRDTTIPGSATVDLVDALRDNYRKDLVYPSRNVQFPRTLKLFQCLAEISLQTESTALGSVLSQFFIKYGKSIARNEHPRALLFWGAAIYSSAMSEGQMVACCREFLAGCPALLRGGVDLEFQELPDQCYAFLQMLEQVALYLDDPIEGEVDGVGSHRGRSRIRGSRRRRYPAYGFPLRYGRDDDYDEYIVPRRPVPMRPLLDRYDAEARLEDVEYDVERCMRRLENHDRRIRQLDEEFDRVPY